MPISLHSLHPLISNPGEDPGVQIKRCKLQVCPSLSFSFLPYLPCPSLTFSFKLFPLTFLSISILYPPASTAFPSPCSYTISRNPSSIQLDGIGSAVSPLPSGRQTVSGAFWVKNHRPLITLFTVLSAQVWGGGLRRFRACKSTADNVGLHYFRLIFSALNLRFYTPL